MVAATELTATKACTSFASPYRGERETDCVLTLVPPAALTAAITLRISAAFAAGAAFAVGPWLTTPNESSTRSGTDETDAVPTTVMPPDSADQLVAAAGRIGAA